ncbi:methylated-DNA--[protein]-cysteine S-methyltransferase [Salisediminibacterium beveridgei]|uniref:Methylated-DNA--protein-cysteine methyltransferase n=1 Tax=Salisediminibacterium beveridgei TaxID=632773 RepID=A0A1D7QWT4_9BACI|nr:methylated-DNA--[protein]-cysteine S-methyltransferase [Salisediminibacterium beveridgei]AOM83461.1 Methylated-DNA--protein-cysteine methyltransferase [Salisediminibacterium beveridgei]
MSNRIEMKYSVMPSPIGDLTLVKSQYGLCFIAFGSSKETICHVKRKLRARQIREELLFSDDDFLEEKLQIQQFFNGERTTFDLATDLYGTPFQKMVWAEVASIPFGETRSYKDIAKAIGAPKAVRAVGGANNQNPLPLVIPCHRVIGSNGSLVGYGGGIDKKEHLLELEGTLSFTRR